MEHDKVIAFIGGSHALLNAQLERLTDQVGLKLIVFFLIFNPEDLTY